MTLIEKILRKAIPCLAIAGLELGLTGCTEVTKYEPFSNIQVPAVVGTSSYFPSNTEGPTTNEILARPNFHTKMLLEKLDQSEVPDEWLVEFKTPTKILKIYGSTPREKGIYERFRKQRGKKVMLSVRGTLAVTYSDTDGDGVKERVKEDIKDYTITDVVSAE